MRDNKPIWLISAEALQKMYPDSQTNFKETLRD